MKATKKGAIIGVALEPFDGSSGSTGKILVFVNLSHGKLDGAVAQGGGSDETGLYANLQTGRVYVAGDFDMGGGAIINLKSLAGIDGKWQIDENGKLIAMSVETEGVAIRKRALPQDGVEVSTIGSGIVPAGHQEARIQNNALVDASKIFVTFRTDLEGKSWHVAEVRGPVEDADGVTIVQPGYFLLRLSGPLSQSAQFDYWIIGITEPTSLPAPPSSQNTGDNNPDTSLPASSPESTASPAASTEPPQSEPIPESPPVKSAPPTSEGGAPVVSPSNEVSQQ